MIKFYHHLLTRFEVTVPIAPLTSPCLVSVFLRNITHAPTASVSSASRPAVKLLSLFSLSISFLAF